MSHAAWDESSCIEAQLHVEVRNPDPAANAAHDQPTPTVILSHGFGGSARNFRPQARALGAEVRFVLYDLRGHARSEKPSAQDAYRLECLVYDLARLVDRYATGKVIVGGLSLGAAVALAYALRHPERVAGVLLAAYPASPSHSAPWAHAFAESIESLGISAAGARYAWGPSSRFDPRTQELIRAGFLEHAPWALAATLKLALARLSEIEALAPLLRKLQSPTRIVVGGDDAGSLASCRALATLIPGATLTVLEGAGHIVNLARVNDFNEQLRQLIAQVRDSRG
jgi:pimeloyl-ACP methyl ester carboxylesterase